MYGYSAQGYGSSYTNPSAAAAAVVNAYAGVQQPSAQQQTGVFGFGDFGTTATTNPYAGYGSSVATANAYQQYGAQNSASAIGSATAYQYGAQNSASAVGQQQAQAQAAYAQASRLGDAYAAQTAAAASLGGLNFGALSSSAANAYSSLRSSAAASTNQSSGYLGAGTMRSTGTSSNTHNSGGSMGHLGSTNSRSGTNAGSGYTGYDAAVYAAASSYLQSKATGQTNMWMSKKSTANTHSSAPGSGGGRSFPTKRYGIGASAGNHRDVQQFYCEVCKISCAGQLTYKEHLEGQRHKKKEALSKGENPVSLPKSKVSFRCDLCNVTCTGQDTYTAHVRGAKHQKTLTLCKKLGKPIPADEPTIIPPKDLGGTMPPPPPAPSGKIPTVGSKAIVGIPTVNFVGGAKLSTTGGAEAKKQAVAAAVGSAGVLPANLDKETSDQVEALIAAEQNVLPVGEEYVEAQRDASGKLITYNCKLCDCKFSDPNAKDIHLKGRRHRLQYKMKVNPNLEVDVKPSSHKNRRGMPMMPRPPAPYMYGQPMPINFGGFPRPWYGGGAGERRFETSDDRHVQAKHTAIYPDDSQLQSMESLVTMVEKGLKNVSDYFTERDSDVVKVKQEADAVTATVEPASEPDRLLKGVMRVGLLAKGLLLKGDDEVELVVLCSKVPTHALLKEVAGLLPARTESTDPLNVRLDGAKASFFVSTASLAPYVCKVTLTSRAIREEGEGEGGVPKKTALSEDMLPEDKCLEALAQLRHAKWFQARCAYLQSCQTTLRILRDVRKRIESWAPLNSWICELLVEKILASCGAPLSVGDAMRRVFEAIASGILFKSGPGLLDPCEKERIDVLAVLTGQQREDITSSAQHALRLIAFNQLYKILGIERLAEPARGAGPNGDRKRPAGANGLPDDDVKKDKKDDDIKDKISKMEV